MSDWVLDVWDFFSSRSKDLENRWSVKALPGWWYTRALALKIKSVDDTIVSCRCSETLIAFLSDINQSTKALQEAIERFPSVLPLLADKTDLSLPADIRGHQKFRIHTDAS
jgi:hypothetical protein